MAQLYTNSTDVEQKYPCFGTYSAAKTMCVGGGITASGTRTNPCDMRAACLGVKASNFSKTLPAAYIVRKTNNPAPTQQSGSPYSLPGDSSPPPDRTAAPVKANKAAAMGAAAAGVVPTGAMSPVTYDAVAPQVASRLPAQEHRRHSKTRRFAAEVARAGIVGAMLQGASFVANVPWLNDDDEDDRLPPPPSVAPPLLHRSCSASRPEVVAARWRGGGSPLPRSRRVSTGSEGDALPPEAAEPGDHRRSPFHR